MLKKLAWLFIVGFAFPIVSASYKFNITEPPDLLKWWQDNHSSMRFELLGEIPSFNKLEGHIALASPLDACSPINLRKVDPNPTFLVAVSGNCEFHVKARNAEQVGAKMLLVVDESYADVESVSIPEISKEQEAFNITTAMLSTEQGLKLIESIKQSQKHKSFVSGSFEYSLENGLSVFSNPDLLQWWTSHSELHHYTIAYFGEVPYGDQIMGQMGSANPIDACSKIQLSNDSVSAPSILLAKRGQCAFNIKARNAEEAGAKLLVIVDNVYEDVETKLLIDASGDTVPIRIATVMIDKGSGDKLIEEVQQSEMRNTVSSGAFNFAVPKQEPVNYNVWLSNGAKRSFEFLQDFKQYHDKLFLLGEMQVHFIAGAAQSSSGPDCICGMKYCAPWTQGDLFNSGAEVVLENLKQLCIIKQFDLDTWWKYVLEFANSCLDSQNTPECSRSILQKLEIDSTDISFCMKASFDLNDYESCKTNSILDKEILIQSTDQPYATPSVKINNFYYRGNVLPSKGVFSAICHSFHKMPEVCNTTLLPPSPSSSGPGGIPSNITLPNQSTNTPEPDGLPSNEPLPPLPTNTSESGGFPLNETLPIPPTNTSEPSSFPSNGTVSLPPTNEPDGLPSNETLPLSPTNTSESGGFPLNETLPIPPTNTSEPSSFPSNVTVPLPPTNSSEPPKIPSPEDVLGGLHPETLPAPPTSSERDPSAPTGSKSEMSSNKDSSEETLSSKHSSTNHDDITFTVNKISLIIVVAVVFCAFFALFVLFLYRRSVNKIKASLQANSQIKGPNMPYAVLGNTVPEGEGNNSSYQA